MIKSNPMFAPLSQAEIDSLRGHDQILFMRTIETVLKKQKQEDFRKKYEEAILDLTQDDEEAK